MIHDPYDLTLIPHKLNLQTILFPTPHSLSLSSSFILSTTFPLFLLLPLYYFPLPEESHDHWTLSRITPYLRVRVLRHSYKLWHYLMASSMGLEPMTTFGAWSGLILAEVTCLIIVLVLLSWYIYLARNVKNKACFEVRDIIFVDLR